MKNPTGQAKELKVGETYLLRTCDFDGNFNVCSEWIEVFFDGKNLVDAEDNRLFWNEWLTPDRLPSSDVFEVEKTKL